jgi:hypothetical protein
MMEHPWSVCEICTGTGGTGVLLTHMAKLRGDCRLTPSPETNA